MDVHVPEWVKHAVFYEICPDRFARSMPKHDAIIESAILEPWDATPTFRGYKGGNLWGVIDRLDYLQALGINAIYLMPIFQATSNHRYHTQNYYQIDALLGGDDAFSALLKAAHQHGIRIILDGVFGHAGRGFFFFNDVLENGPASPWVNWFKVTDWPLAAYEHERPANYAGWLGNRELPQFNHDNPAVREYLMKVAEYWTEQGIDGWRLDAPNTIQTTGFWQEFRERIKGINPDAYILGEVGPRDGQPFEACQFDGVMNYPFRRHTTIFAAGTYAASIPPEYLRPRGDIPAPHMGAAAYADKMAHLLASHPCNAQFVQLNLLASHDTARPITTLGEDRARLELATLLLLTSPGAPCIYYGDEVGLPGGPDPDCRRSFPAEAQWDREVLAFHRKLITLRHAYPALRTGVYQPLLAHSETYVFARMLGDEELIVAVNAGTQRAEVSVDQVATGQHGSYVYTLKTQPREVLYGRAEIQWRVAPEPARLTLVLPPRSTVIVGPASKQ